MSKCLYILIILFFLFMYNINNEKFKIYNKLINNKAYNTRSVRLIQICMCIYRWLQLQACIAAETTAVVQFFTSYNNILLMSPPDIVNSVVFNKMHYVVLLKSVSICDMPYYINIYCRVVYTHTK